MKKRLRYISFLLILALVFSYRPVLASSIENVTAKVNDTGLVTVSGNISSGKGKVVNVRVTNQFDMVNHADTVISGKNGAFTFT